LYYDHRFPRFSYTGVNTRAVNKLDIAITNDYYQCSIEDDNVLLKEIKSTWDMLKSLHHVINLNTLLEEFSRNLSENQSHDKNSGITEEQRKLIVQANAANDVKQYFSALEYYEKAMALDPFSFPAAYFNMALISERVNRYEDAIFNMKKYLILVPDADDARAAQDKIYEWEYKMNN
jgi:tetratricopeptide (TPR) repeat protein